VRLWQGGSQVQAPVIEMDRAQQRLTARGGTSAGGAQTAQVHTVLMSAGSDASSAAKYGAEKAAAGKPGTGARSPDVMRIAAAGWSTRGACVRRSLAGRARGDGRRVGPRQRGYGLFAAGRWTGALVRAEEVPSIAGSVERMVATGQIEIEQPDAEQRANVWQ